MTVLQLHKPKPCDDVVDGLRKLADAIEGGLLSTVLSKGWDNEDEE